MNMPTSRANGHPVLIVGAGRGGSALLEMFLEDSLVEVVAMVDTNPDAPGLKMARVHGIPAYTDAREALLACRGFKDCIIYNLSHDDQIAAQANEIMGGQRVASGPEVKLFWQMVTNLKQTKTELQKSQDQLQAIIQNAMDGIITINEKGLIEGFNPAAEQIFGYASDEVRGQNVSLLMPEPNRSAHDGYLSRYTQTGAQRILGARGREVIAIRKSGEEFPMELSASKMVLGGQCYFVGIVRDITERKLTEEKIAHLAHFDFLTDLPNRVRLTNTLEHSLRLAKRNQNKVAVLFLDLDGFKQVNDTLGHNIGDQLLQQVAARLAGAIRDSDTVARVGGDEFNFVLDNIESCENAAMVAQKVLAALSEPFDLSGNICQVGGSIGIAMYPEDSEDVEGLIGQADEAMYQVKQSGKNAWRFYRDCKQV